MDAKVVQAAGRTLLALVMLALAVPACTTLDPYTREEKTSSATKGAVVGAAAGAAVGAIARGDRRSVLIGAGIGALAGGVVGNYMDQQEDALRARLEGSGVSVSRAGEQITLNMPGNITFATNSADVTSGFYEVLNSVSLVLAEFEQTYVDVVGHTDSTGSLAYNRELSVRRADSVGGYLQGQGIEPARFIISGAGPSFPVASNATPEGRALNRRVEIVLTPLT
jgi:outer membrane protein OmpA-like peptidoglycan-associated protein